MCPCPDIITFELNKLVHMSRIIQRHRSNFIVNERQKLLVELFVLKWARAVVATSTEQRSPVISQFCFHVSVAQRRYFETIQIEAYFLPTDEHTFHFFALKNDRLQNKVIL